MGGCGWVGVGGKGGVRVGVGGVGACADGWWGSGREAHHVCVWERVCDRERKCVCERE